MEKNCIKKTMLGHLALDIDFVLITPLKSTFYRLKDTLTIIEEYNKCFFENFVFRLNEKNKNGLIVLSPQGVSAKDIIELFENSKILFFGLAGSLNENLKIGSFVEVQNAVDENNNDVTLSITGKFETVKCGYSPCLLGNIAKKHCDLARKKNCDVVDMETSYCATTAKEHNNKFTSFLLISDIPEVQNFWEVSVEEQAKLKQSRLIAIEQILQYINILL